MQKDGAFYAPLSKATSHCRNRVPNKIIGKPHFGPGGEENFNTFQTTSYIRTKVTIQTFSKSESAPPGDKRDTTATATPHYKLPGGTRMGYEEA